MPVTPARPTSVVTSVNSFPAGSVAGGLQMRSGGGSMGPMSPSVQPRSRSGSRPRPRRVMGASYAHRARPGTRSARARRGVVELEGQHGADGAVAKRLVEPLGLVVAAPHGQHDLLGAALPRPAPRLLHEQAAAAAAP